MVRSETEEKKQSPIDRQFIEPCEPDIREAPLAGELEPISG